MAVELTKSPPIIRYNQITIYNRLQNADVLIRYGECWAELTGWTLIKFISWRSGSSASDVTPASYVKMSENIKMYLFEVHPAYEGKMF